MVRLSGLGSGHAHAVVVVHFLDGHLGALGGDVVEAGLAAALGHVDHGLLAQLVGGPGHAAAVVAVGGSEEGGLTEVPAEGLAGEIVIGHLRHIPAHLLGDVPAHGEGAAQHLEGVESEAVGFVLHVQATQPQILGHAVQLGQRRDGVLREAAVEEAGLRHVGQGHQSQLTVVGLRHLVQYPFDFFHWCFPPFDPDHPGLNLF